MRPLLALSVLLPLAAPLVACGGPSVVHVQVNGAPDLNPSGGRAFPAQVRLYQLTDASRFSNADYFQLTDHETDALGPTLVRREEFTLRPGESRTVDVQADSRTRVLGVAVAYRNIDGATWRATLPVRGTMHLAAGASAVSLAP